MSILRSLLFLIVLILILNLVTGSLFFRQFVLSEQSLEHDVVLGRMIQNESRMQILAGNYLHTRNEQFYHQYLEVLKSLISGVNEAEQAFQGAGSQQIMQSVKKKMSQLQTILKKYRDNRKQWQNFSRTQQLKKLEMAWALDNQLSTQWLIISQEMVMLTLQLHLSAEEKNYHQAQAHFKKLYALLGMTILIVGLFSYFIYKGISRRFAYISSAAKKLGKGELSVRIKSEKKDDMKYLVQAFNFMAAKLELAEKRNYQMLQDAERQAHHDSLTDLPNRRLLSEQMDREVARAIRHNLKGALIFIDLDNFKALNDSKGHSAGDILLIEVSRRMQQQIRSEDTLARMGGDEFVVLLSELGDSSDLAAAKAERVAEKINQAISLPYRISGDEFTITGSLGICVFPDDGHSSEELLSHSDVAMYQSKAKGRNYITFYSAALQEKIDTQVRLETEFSKAINNNSLETWYQPKIDLQGNIVGAEVLARWNNPDKGWISPEQFIPVAEKSGLIIPFGEWLIEHISKTLLSWHEKNLCPNLQHLSVNISPKQFYEWGFIESLLEMETTFQTTSTQLILEITEGVLLSHSDEVIKGMALLKDHGVHISIDDFGTGYSSMAYLKRLALGELKIDRSFVKNVHKDEDNQVIVEMIMAMAQHFGMTVVAEGVEEKEELEFLQKKGCHLYQGFYYSKPLAEEKFLRFLNQHNKKVVNG